MSVATTAHEVAMPRLSDSMEEGTVTSWMKADGDTVTKGEPIVEIETDKAIMAFEAEADGTLRIVAAEGDSLPIGAVIAYIGSADFVPPQTPQAGTEPVPLPVLADSQAVPVSEPRAAGTASARPKASPVARRLAAALEVDLAGVMGSGPLGRIVKRDVLAQSETPSATASSTAAATPAGAVDTAKGDVTRVEPSRLQVTVARRMADAKASAPDFVVERDVDVSELVEWRSELRKNAADGAVVPSVNDFVVKAAARALEEHPNVNAAYRDGGFERYGRINVGVAVAGEGSLVVATVFDANRRSLTAIAVETRRLAERARAGTITPPELSGGTFTVSNLGMFGVERFTAILNPPQAAILAVGSARPTPTVVDGELAVAQQLTLRLTADHRILNGADAATFLGRIHDLLRRPYLMVVT